MTLLWLLLLFLCSCFFTPGDLGPSFFQIVGMVPRFQGVAGFFVVGDDGGSIVDDAG